VFIETGLYGVVWHGGKRPSTSIQLEFRRRVSSLCLSRASLPASGREYMFCVPHRHPAPLPASGLHYRRSIDAQRRPLC